MELATSSDNKAGPLDNFNINGSRSNSLAVGLRFGSTVKHLFTKLLNSVDHFSD